MKRLNRPLPVPSSRVVLTVWTIVAALIIAGGVWLTVFVLDSRRASQADRADLRSQLVTAQGRLDSEEAASELLADQVESLGEEPVVEPRSGAEPSALVPVPGPRGPAASFAAVTRAVGQQIDAALADACGGSCKGEPGESVTGPRGPAGESITGPPGQSIVGPKGDTGDKGDPGRGIESAMCGDDGRWTITYTDDTTSDAGLCRESLLPAP